MRATMCLRGMRNQKAAQRTHTARQCRAHLLGPVEEDSTFGVLIELARPQVHGFDPCQKRPHTQSKET